MRKVHAFPRRQRGAALLVGLIFLVLLALLATSVAGSTALQERMTSGQRNVSLARTAANSALREGEGSLWQSYETSDGHRFPSATTAAEPESSVAALFRRARGWLATEGTPYARVDYAGLDAHPGSSTLANAPRYHIEHLAGMTSSCLESHCGGATYGGGVLGLSDWFRVTARSTGGDARVMRATESVFAMGR